MSVVVTYNGTTVTVYVDGVSVGSQNRTLSSSSLVWVVGGAGPIGPSGFYFTGAIDDARVYDRALSPTDVQLLYTMGS